MGVQRLPLKNLLVFECNVLGKDIHIYRTSFEGWCCMDFIGVWMFLNSLPLVCLDSALEGGTMYGYN